MKEENHGRKNIKGDNYLCITGCILCDLTQNSSLDCQDLKHIPQFFILRAKSRSGSEMLFY